MRRDIVDGLLEFHRDDDGNLTIIERDCMNSPWLVVVPADVWQRVWPQLVSVAEMRKLSGEEYP